MGLHNITRSKNVENSSSKNAGAWAIFMREVPFESIGKGSYITPEVIERATGFMRGSNEYSLQSLRLKDMIESWFEEHENPVTIKIEQDGLRILTDTEATEYNHRMFKIGMRRLFESHRKMLNVNEKDMTQEQVSAHRQRVNAQAHVTASVWTQNQTLRLIPYSRQVPTIGDSIK